MRYEANAHSEIYFNSVKTAHTATALLGEDDDANDVGRDANTSVPFIDGFSMGFATARVARARERARFNNFMMRYCEVQICFGF